MGQRLLFAFAFIVSVVCATASDSLDIPKPLSHPKATLKVNPTCLVDPNHHSLFFASDIWLSKNVVLELGSGWFFASTINTKYRGEKFNGYRGRLGFKYMFVNRSRAIPFLGVEGKYNFI